MEDSPVQVLFGLQQRAAQGVKTRDGVLRWICDELRRQQVATLAGARVLPGLGNDRRGTLNSLRTDARRGLLDCETETGKDDWDLTVFGHAGAVVHRDQPALAAGGGQDVGQPRPAPPAGPPRR